MTAAILQFPMRRLPLTRAECEDGPRPCELTHCRYNLRGDFKRANETCALDVAEHGPHTLAEVGHAIGSTRERVRQIEAVALRRLGKRQAMRDYSDYEPPPDSRVHLVHLESDNDRRIRENQQREPSEREWSWLHMADPKVSDRDYCRAVYSIYARGPYREPCPSIGCLGDKGHDGGCTRVRGAK